MQPTFTLVALLFSGRTYIVLDVTVLQVIPRGLSADEELIVQQAFAGLCWSKQFYRFDGSSLYSTEGGMSAVFQ